MDRKIMVAGKFVFKQFVIQWFIEKKCSEVFSGEKKFICACVNKQMLYTLTGIKTSLTELGNEWVFSKI